MKNIIFISIIMAVTPTIMIGEQDHTPCVEEKAAHSSFSLYSAIPLTAVLVGGALLVFFNKKTTNKKKTPAPTPLAPITTTTSVAPTIGITTEELWTFFSNNPGEALMPSAESLLIQHPSAATFIAKTLENHMDSIYEDDRRLLSTLVNSTDTYKGVEMPVLQIGLYKKLPAAYLQVIQRGGIEYDNYVPDKNTLYRTYEEHINGELTKANNDNDRTYWQDVLKRFNQTKNA